MSDDVAFAQAVRVQALVGRCQIKIVLLAIDDTEEQEKEE